jgi:hypothetical protein
MAHIQIWIEVLVQRKSRQKYFRTLKQRAKILLPDLSVDGFALKDQSQYMFHVQILTMDTRADCRGR